MAQAQNNITSNGHASAPGLHPAKEVGHKTGQFLVDLNYLWMKGLLNVCICIITDINIVMCSLLPDFKNTQPLHLLSSAHLSFENFRLCASVQL